MSNGLDGGGGDDEILSGFLLLGYTSSSSTSNSHYSDFDCKVMNSRCAVLWVSEGSD